MTVQSQTLACQLCGRTSLQVIEQRLSSSAVYRCCFCDFAFVHPQPAVEALKQAYESGYYEEWVTVQAKPRQRLWRRRAEEALGGLAPGYLLDVGCGEGSFLHAAKALGWQVTGTEISADAIRLARQQWQIEPFRGNLEEAHFPDNRFDAITLWHVIEHVPNPEATLREVARIARPGARIIIACPNRRGLLFQAVYFLGRLRRPHLYDPSDREIHLSHFSVGSLRFLLRRCGLQVLRVDVDRGHVQAVKHWLDLSATAVNRVTGLVWSEAMEVWACKPA